LHIITFAHQKMKHLPNLLTLANLFCGCVAIAYILTAQPYLTMSLQDGLPSWRWIYGVQQMYLGSLFIGIAALCDMLDGLAARALQVFSPIGKDLDSLADLVSFGVAPSMILFKFLWDALMGQKNAMDVSMLGMAPAFLLACFAALRLAKFNITTQIQRAYFVGVPTPAVGLFIATLPLLNWYNPMGLGAWLQNVWVLYIIIALVCLLMVSPIRCFKLLPTGKGIKNMWQQIALIAGTVILFPILRIAAFPVAFLLYVALSVIGSSGHSKPAEPSQRLR
jgi:CDP-diacylglycerol---serine O-phosphatidyltransferase